MYVHSTHSAGCEVIIIIPYTWASVEWVYTQCTCTYMYMYKYIQGACQCSPSPFVAFSVVSSAVMLMMAFFSASCFASSTAASLALFRTGSRSFVTSKTYVHNNILDTCRFRYSCTHILYMYCIHIIRFRAGTCMTKLQTVTACKWISDQALSCSKPLYSICVNMNCIGCILCSKHHSECHTSNVP